MVTPVLSPTPVQSFRDSNGAPLSGGKLFTYTAGTTTKQSSYTSSTGTTQNANPIILNARGECNLWLDPTLTYKLVLALPTDTDPPTNPIWTVDNISAGQLSALNVMYQPAGAGAVTRTVQDKIKEGGLTPADFGTGGGNEAVPLGSAFTALGRTSPVNWSGWGIGTIHLPAGEQTWASTFQPYAPLGLTIQGASRYATTRDWIGVGGTAIYLTDYNSVRLCDFLLQATGTAAGSAGSIGLHTYGQDGGGFLTVERMRIDNFNTGILNDFNGNGDKALYVQAEINCNYGYDNTGNRQAIGHTFLNCAGTSNYSGRRLGGNGLTLMINEVFDTRGSYISFPEGSGNPGSSNWPQVSITFSSKLEQHGNNTPPWPGQNMLVDATQSKLVTDAGGSNVTHTFIETILQTRQGRSPTRTRSRLWRWAIPPTAIKARMLSG